MMSSSFSSDRVAMFGVLVAVAVAFVVSQSGVGAEGPLMTKVVAVEDVSVSVSTKGGGGGKKNSFNTNASKFWSWLGAIAEAAPGGNKGKPGGGSGGGSSDEGVLGVAKTKNNEARSFLKFDVAGLTTQPLSAKILLRSTKNSSAEGGSIARVSDSDWSEDTMTWETQPAIDGPVLASVGAVSDADYYEWDVTSEITGNGTYSFALTCGSCNAEYNSSEASEHVPYLVLVLAEEQIPVHVDDHQDEFFTGAGDIADCSLSGDEATADLLDGVPGTIFTAGDNAYPDGKLAEFQNCYEPSWGRHKERTRPVPGNHDYHTAGAQGYFDYFGAAAGGPQEGYYSYDVGGWHVVALNSNCAHIGGCEAGSAQEQWLRADLAANSSQCVLAYTHHPRFSSGKSHGSDAEMQPIFQTLYDMGGDVFVSGHDHTYERFAPQDPNGVTDLESGLRQFVVGTGKDTRQFATPIANSEVRGNEALGVLKFTLHPDRYDWEFLPEAGETFTDNGTSLCH